jgi:hypothetical protein
MCRLCWESYDSPSSITPKVIEVLEELKSLCATSSALGVIVDDWNVEDHILEYFLVHDVPEEEISFIKNLMKLELPERATVLALYENLI